LTLDEVWEKLAPEFSKTLVASISKRCQGVRDTKGDEKSIKFILLYLLSKNKHVELRIQKYYDISSS
jgi:hypothetical protein